MSMETAQDFIRFGDEARDRRDWPNARAHYERAVELDRLLAPIWIQLGHAAKESGDSAAAETAYRNALELNPEDADGYLQFGHLMKISGRFPAALAYYSRAVALAPKLVNARREVAGLWRRGDVSGRQKYPHVEATDIDRFRRQASPTAGPDFLGLGMAKAGTGWLFDQLKFHPDFWMPPDKEFGYLKREAKTLKIHGRKRLAALRKGEEKLVGWSNRRPWDERDVAFLQEAAVAMGNPKDVVSYAALFRYKEDKISGDITPGYGLLEPDVVAEVAKWLPNVKLVLLVRDPVERLLSHISMRARNEGFNTRLLDDGARFSEFLRRDKTIAEASFASQVVERWRTHAPNLQLRWFSFSDLRADPGRLLSRILSYLGADDRAIERAEENKKVGVHKLQWTEAARRVVVQHLREELFACVPLFGEEAEGWIDRYREYL